MYTLITAKSLWTIICIGEISLFKFFLWVIPEPWKRFLDPDSGKESVYWSENQTFSDIYEKTVDS